MDCYGRSSEFGNDSNMNLIESEVIGVLEIHAHHARNIHNICIYDNQDVYAKFSLTCNPNETLSTRIVAGGGKNPDFNDRLFLKIPHLDAVVKCEIWMMSRARKFMEDQLLGFALVPVSQVVGKRKVTGDYSLSSTDLFHSPAGTVHLTFSLDTAPNLKPSESPSISSEVVLLDRKADKFEYSRIEFPDINVVSENQKMVSEYITSRQTQFASFLHLGAHQLDRDHEMAANSPENAGFMSSTTTSLSDEGEKKPTSSDPNENMSTWSKGSEGVEESEKMREKSYSDVQMEAEEEECAMQKQIVDMYMRSMHQFTESLAKMKLPMDGGDLIQTTNANVDMEATKKKDGSRVFYGSRAFF